MIFIILASFVFLIASSKAISEERELSVDITNTDIESLLNLPITAASRSETTLRKTAAAVFIVTNEQIRQSGATSIPEALRLVPGVTVARVDANKWTVSIRGFNSRLSNKLLVLLDGRILYDPYFSGVLWETKDVMLEDVDRIEVVRGPGNATWGSNAVNGIINIITKNARDTQGGLLTAGGGTEERRFGAARYGEKFGESGYARIYGKYYNRDAGYIPGSPEPDDTSEAGQAGFRIDWGKLGSDTLTVQSDTYVGNIGNLDNGLAGRADSEGTNFLVNWAHWHAEESKSSVLGYFDYNDIGSDLLSEARTTFNLEIKNESSLSEDNFLVVGVEARNTRDSLKLVPPLFIDPEERRDELYSLFFEDRHNVTSSVSVSAGVRVEHNDYTDWEVQPSARATWNINEVNMVWAGFSRSVRTPSRLESDQYIQVGDIRATGSKDLDAEELYAYELGSRHHVHDDLFLDLATFIYKYDRIVTAEFLTLGNGAQALNYGGEVAITYQPFPWWSLSGSYSLLKMQLDLNPDSIADRQASVDRVEGSSPANMANFISRISLGEQWEWNFDIRYTDSLPGINVGSYIVGDTMIAYRPLESFEIAVVGQNLFRAHHYEQRDAISTAVEQGVYGKVTWTF